MRGLQLQSLVTADQTVELSLTDVETDEPGPDQVVVRVEAAPINPSDLGVLLAGADPAQATAIGTAEQPAASVPLSAGAASAAAARVGTPMPVGNEGAGTVVAAGAGAGAQALLGKVVSFAGGATYSQYRIAEAAICLPLPDGAAAADGAASFVNPMTALGMVGTMRAEGHTALVHTAAASSLGQMLNRLCLEEDVPLVNIVRSAEQVQILRDQGAAHVCDSTAATFDADLLDAVRATGATLAFDAIGGGPLVSRILHAMEAAASAGAAFERYGSTVHKQVYIYGSLDRQPTELARTWGMAWGVGGWLLTPYLMKAGQEEFGRMRQRVAAGLTTTFATRFTDRLTLTEALDPAAIAVYGRPSTGKKFLITP